MNPYTLFAEIIAGTAESSKVFEDDTVVAFMDIRPLTHGHLLVVPKRTVRSLAQLDPELGGHMFAVGQKLAAAVRASDPNVKGINLYLADGTLAGQEIFHVHLHVIPRTSGDGFSIHARPQPQTRAQLDAQAASIAAAIA